MWIIGPIIWFITRPVVRPVAAKQFRDDAAKIVNGDR
jgi:hypothetical protein